MTSPDRKRFVPEGFYKDALKGLMFFSLKNRNGSAIIPSTKNFLNGFHIPKIKCDDGATCTIMPIKNIAMLEELFILHKDCIFKILPLRSVGGVTLSLNISGRLDKRTFDFRIGLDIYSRASVKPVACSLASEFLQSELDSPELDNGQAIGLSNYHKYQPIKTAVSANFFLCTDDITHILARPDMLAMFHSSDLEGLKPYDHPVPRRNTALLGNDFLGLYHGMVGYKRVKFYFDTQVHKLEHSSWEAIEGAATDIVGMKYLKSSSTDFQLLDSIEVNDVLGFVPEEDGNPDDDEESVG